jgi:plastocyanin
MRLMKGARALASGTLVLALSCAIPAISAAQDAGTTTDVPTTTTATTPEPTPPPAEPGNGSAGDAESADKGKQDRPDQDAQPPAPPVADAQPAPAAGPTKGSGRARASASASVTMGDFFFSPTSVTVAVGDTVTWRNNGDAPHNARADDGSFSTPDLNKGQSASHRFSQAGNFSYICTIHPQMKGTVRVLSSGGGGDEGGGDASSSSGGAGTSEASAVASPEAAGDANTLPMTGMSVGGMALVGFALVGLGMLARHADHERSRRRWHQVF